jgi:hypothetical protein
MSLLRGRMIAARTVEIPPIGPISIDEANKPARRTHVKHLFSLLFAFLTPAMATGSDMQVEATNAAKDWLVLIDQGNYHAGWDQAAASLKAAQPRETWTNTIATRRSELGALYVREVTGYRFKPGLSESDLHTSVVRFRSQFAGGLLKETVTLELAEGTWRTAEYSLG